MAGTSKYIITIEYCKEDPDSFLSSCQKHNMAVYTENTLETASQPPRLYHSATEAHSNAGDVVRDIIIGFADGLTVPFALTAGLSSLGSSKLVIVGGLAELFSGSISMGLGAYLAAVTDRDRYLAEFKREEEEVRVKPEDEKEEIYDIFAKYGVTRDACQGVVDYLVQDEEAWLQVSMIIFSRTISTSCWGIIYIVFC